MNRFILGMVVMVLMLGLGSAWAPLQAAVNSKRPLAPAPTLLTATSPAFPASHALAHAAKGAAQATASIVSNEVALAAAKARVLAGNGSRALGNGFARLTAYWSSEGDYYTRRHVASTGVHLHNGHCAVDPTVIPYGSIVEIEGLGTYLAVDTGTAVVSRRAARESGHNHIERHALVIDLYFDNRRDGERFAANGPKFAAITWRTPSPTDALTTTTRASGDGLIALADTPAGKEL